MTGRDLLCAIAEIDDGIVLASGQFSAVGSIIKDDRKRIRQRFTAIGIAAVICIAVFGAVNSMQRFFKGFTSSDTTTVQTSLVLPPTSAPSQTVPAIATDATAQANAPSPAETTETPSSGAAATTEVPVSQGETVDIPSETVSDPAPATVPAVPPTVPESEAGFYQLYTYVIVSAAFSDYRLGKAVGEETVGALLEDAAATGVYVRSDGTMLEDETLRCEIFALTDIDPGIAVCVRFVDRGKGLKTDRYYLLYHPDADLSALEAYLTP